MKTLTRTRISRVIAGAGLVLALAHTEKAQALAAGDLAVIAMQGDPTYPATSWAVVALASIPSGTTVFFTDAGITETGVFFSSATNEGHLTWNVTTTVPAGTVLVMNTASGTNSSDLNGATAGTGGLSDYGTVSGGVGGTANIFNTSGDQIIIYQGTSGTTTGATFIYGFSTQQNGLLTGLGVWQTSGNVTSSQQSYMPTGLTNAASPWTANALTTNTAGLSSPNVVSSSTGTANYGFDNMVYGGPTSGTKAQLLQYIADPTNWKGDNTTPFSVGVGAGYVFTNNFTISGANPPTFPGGSPQSLSVCQNAAATSINSLLQASDIDNGQTLTWSVTSAPSHGSLGGFNATASTNGSTVTPSGLTYTPTNGYSGSDAFTVQVSDGSFTASTTINVTINPIPAQPGAFTSSSANVCAGSTGVAYAIASVTNATSYTWTYTGGANVTINGSGTSVTADFASNATSGSVNVTANNTCGSSTARSIAVTVGTTNTWSGGSSTAWSNTANWTCGFLPTATTDAVINSGTSFQPIVDINSAVCNNLTINSGATLSFTGTTNVLDIKGTVTNNGTFDPSAGTTKLSGAGAQTLPGGTYKTLQLSGGDKTFAGNVAITGGFTLTSGMALVNTNTLTIGASAAITGGSASSFIVINGAGKLVNQGIGPTGKSGAVLFPVGYNSSSYTPASITNTGTLDNYTVQLLSHVYASYNNSVPNTSAVTANAVDRSWIVDEGTPGGSNATVTLQWSAGDELIGFDRTNCYVSHYNNTTNFWQPGSIGTATGSNPYTKSMTGITSFSPFGVGSLNSPLPMDLVSFTGNADSKGIMLNWVTADERSIDHFDLERSYNGADFNRITVRNAMGTTSGKNFYNYLDADQMPEGAVYYRLKIAEQNGKFTYSNIIAVAAADASKLSVSLFPNPVKGNTLTLKTKGNATGNMNIVIVSPQGRILHSEAVSAAAYNAGGISVNTGLLSTGVYILELTDGKYNVLQSVPFSRE